MIDFRYHVVSLVSVFIALAVGILLGAGPLKEPLEQGVSQTIQQQIDGLRQDRQKLRDQLDSSQTSIEHRDGVIAGVTPALVRDRLAERSVVLVVLPDAPTGRVGDLTRQLETSGASVVGRLDVQAAWNEPKGADDRAALAARLVAGLPPGSPIPAGSGSGPDAVLAGLLARALVAPTRATAGTPDPAATAILDGLVDADLVAVDGSLDARAGLAVVLAPGVESATVTATSSRAASTSAASGAPSAADEAARPWNPLVAALDAASEGSVVLGPGSSATTGGVVADIRADGDLARRASTIDTGETAMGDLTTVLALVEQAAGEAGAYGFGAGSTAPLPEIAQALTVPPPAAATATP
jgi:hypothetical protein